MQGQKKLTNRYTKLSEDKAAQKLDKLNEWQQ
jgi:hypothetical protein